MAEATQIRTEPGALARAADWFDTRFPSAGAMFRAHMSQYYAPKNFNFWYFFGVMSIVVLVMQILTGVFLTMNYKPAASDAFASVEYIMRDVPWGWLIRYMHSTGASAFFIVVYLHMYRGLIYGSHRKPRELVWIFGCAIFLALMAEAFMGYLLPWGQMSYWGAQVIINLFSAIPFVGPDLALLIRGDYVVGDATLNRFFAFHVIAVPLVLLGLVVAHIFALHDVGSNNPDGIEIKGPGAPLDANGHPLDGIPFHPYYSVHDILGIAVFLLVFSAIIFFAPEGGGYFLEYNNFIPADSFKTPPHIAPVWYFTPFYSMLRAITSEMMYALSAILVLGIGFVLVKTRASSMTKGLLVVVMIAFLWMFNAFGFTGVRFLNGLDAKFWGVVVMFGSVLTMFFLPWLDKSPVKSIRYRPGWHKAVIGVFVVVFVVLAYLGTEPPSPTANLISQIGTLFYFGFFWLMPWWSRLGEFKPVPQRVTYAAH